MNADPSGLNDITYRIIGAAQTVSRTLGIGFAEKTYERAMCVELRNAQLLVDRQKVFPVLYDGHLVGEYIPDLIVTERIIVEIKAVGSVDKVHRAQCISYLRATSLPLCLLLNFGPPRLEVVRIVLTR
jgi:GxxExxY protein